MKHLKSIIFVSIFLLSAVLILAAFRGLPGENGKLLRFQDQADYDSYPTSPFEATNSNSRFTLIESILERGTFLFTPEQAKFSAPDIVYYQGQFFSIFTPGISFLAFPFYLLGKSLGLTQLITFQFNILALLLNICLIVTLAKKFGANKYAGLLGGLIYVFATNSLAYSLSLAQHQFSSTLVLLAILNATAQKRGLLNNLGLGLLYGLGVLVDIPNAFALFPALIYVLYRHFTLVSSNQIKVNLHMLALIFSTLPFLAVFAWYNYTLTGSKTLLGQTIGRSDFPPKLEEKKETGPDNPFGFIRPELPLGTRLQLNGFYQLLFSNERGWFYFSPIVFIGLLGLYQSRKREGLGGLSVLCLSTIIATVVVYSMHGDPWGGWAFGARYMIPSSALAAAGLAATFTRYSKRPLFILAFVILTGYSLAVSVSGALTTTLIPPKVEAVYAQPNLPYSFNSNMQYIFDRNITGSLAYHLWLQDRFDVKTFYYLYCAIAGILIAGTYLLALSKKTT